MSTARPIADDPHDAAQRRQRDKADPERALIDTLQRAERAMPGALSAAALDHIEAWEEAQKAAKEAERAAATAAAKAEAEAKAKAAVRTKAKEVTSG